MWSQFLALVDGAKIPLLMILIAVDFVAGVVVAIKDGTFQFARLADFLNTTILCGVGGYILVGLLAVAHPEFSSYVVAAYVALDTSLVAMIWGKLSKILPWLPAPKWIAGG